MSNLEENARLSHELNEALETIEMLKRDGERIDWLANPSNLIGNVQLPSKCVTDNMGSLRDGIDKAMRINDERSEE